MDDRETLGLVIGDSSALVALATCGALGYLEELADEIEVPGEVFEEAVVEGKPYSEELREFLRSRVVQVRPADLIVTASLGHGELEAMALFRRSGADVLLVDDEKARKIATFNKIPIIGGILVAAKQQGLVPAVRPLVALLRASPLFFNEALLERVLRLAGED